MKKRRSTYNSKNNSNVPKVSHGGMNNDINPTSNLPQK